MIRPLLPLALLLLSPLAASAQRYVRVDTGRPVYPVPVLVRPVQPTPQTTAAVAPDPAADSFLAWLNATRARYGLRAVGYDPALAGDAYQNSLIQARRGLGHFHMGRARRQNSGMGPYAAMPGMWLASAPHRAALLDPTITAVGIAGAGMYWTFSAY